MVACCRANRSPTATRFEHCPAAKSPVSFRSRLHQPSLTDVASVGPIQIDILSAPNWLDYGLIRVGLGRLLPTMDLSKGADSSRGFFASRPAPGRATCEGRLYFSALQQRLGAGPKTLPLLVRLTPAGYVAFDVLAVAGHDARALPLSRRRAPWKNWPAAGSPRCRSPPLPPIRTRRPVGLMTCTTGIEGLVAPVE